MAYKILIVDDSKLARMFVGKALSAVRPDWTRLEAANADEALEMVGRERPDIIMMDINMPGRDGLGLASELSALNPNMPIAIVSANMQDEVIAQTRQIGATFIAKPLTEQALADFLNAAQARLGGPTK